MSLSDGSSYRSHVSVSVHLPRPVPFPSETPSRFSLTSHLEFGDRGVGVRMGKVRVYVTYLNTGTVFLKFWIGHIIVNL